MKAEETTAKQEFIIIWLENHKRVISNNAKELDALFVRDYPDLKLKIVSIVIGDGGISKSLSELENELKKQNVELVVTDYDLGEDGYDKKVVNAVKRGRPVTDVLMYSGGVIKKEDKEELRNNYGFIEFVENSSTPTDEIWELSKKHLTRFKDLMFLRGLVITNAIELELRINNFLAAYLLMKNEPQKTRVHKVILENHAYPVYAKTIAMGIVFRTELLEEFDGKDKSAKEKTVKDFTSKINGLMQTRNNLAHCKCADGKELTVTTIEGDISYNIGKVNEILNSMREVGERIDILRDKL
jgi:hypothetical protein